MYKYEELAQYYREYILENGYEWAKEHKEDIHHHAFNENYYIIGTYKAKQWLADKVFNVIEIVREYEQDNFGVVNTDFSDPEKIVNMYVYIVGEQVVNNITLEDIFATWHCTSCRGEHTADMPYGHQDKFGKTCKQCCEDLQLSSRES